MAKQLDEWETNHNLHLLERQERAISLLTELKISLDTPYCVTSIAGLQYYDIEDEKLSGDVQPEVAERLLLVREPSNPYDANAIQVRNENGEYMLGHIPRDIAEILAPVLDALKDISACCWRKYNGETWSLSAIVYGKDLPTVLHDKTWQSVPYPKEKYEYDLSKIRAAGQFNKERNLRRERSRKEITATFLADEIEEYINNKVQDLSEIVDGDFVKKRDLKDKIFTCEYYDLPKNLKTKTTWSSYGYKPKKGAKPYAKKGEKIYGKVRHLDLYHARDLEPKKVTKTTREKWTNEYIRQHLNKLRRFGDED